MLKYLYFTFLLLLYFSTTCFSQKPVLSKNNIHSISTTSPNRTNFNINNISTWIYNNGDQDITIYGNSGFEFPKGSGKYAIFESGIVWGGKINNKIHVGGSTYNHGLRPGRILEDGTPQSEEDPSNRIYRVRPDYIYGDLSSEVSDEELSQQEILSNYEKDWQEWPAEWGAPYNDIDNDGNYNPSIDVPGVPGAHQTIWYVANDFDTATTLRLYGSDPMNVEFQVTIWGYNIPQSGYENIMFKKYKLINKSNVEIDSMFISQWADTDIGDAGDDYVGCDTLLNLMYCYNGNDDDAVYGSIIPAIGYQLLQGPIIKSADSDSAFFNNTKIAGYKNIEMKTHYYFIGSDPIYNDPNLGDYDYGTLQFYRLFRGRITFTGTPFKDPLTGKNVVFTLAGNPITKEGWIDGILHPPGDRRNGFTTGPFKLTVGETQEFVISQFASMGTDRLNSITKLKEQASILKKEYPSLIPVNYSSLYSKVNKLRPATKQNIYNSYDVIELNIERLDSVENFSDGGYQFQGYNIYQYKQESNFNSSGKLLFTFDKIDDITTIYGSKYDPLFNDLINDVIYNGSNSGFPQKIIIGKDYLDNSELIKGKTYYYGITAYYYNKNENKAIETHPNTLNIVYQEDLPGAQYLDTVSVIQDIGTSNSIIDVQVINPYELTGDTYKVSFGEQHYYLNEDGEWEKTNYPDSVGTLLNKPSDQTPSTLLPMPSIYAPNHTLDLHFELNIQAPDFNYVDGVKLTFPDGIQINSAEESGDYHIFTPIIDGQIVTWGSPDTTGDGGFSGGEDLMVNINAVDPTFSVDFVIYDDGWSESYIPQDPQYFNLGAGTVHGSGSVTLTGETGYKFKTVKYWELHNTTKGIEILDEIPLEGYYSRWNLERLFSEYYEADGFKIRVGGSTETSMDIMNYEVNGISYLLSTGGSSSRFSITDYGIHGWAASGRSIDAFGNGTNDINILQKDYELRFTGELDNSIYGITKIKSGTGSKATLYGARSYSLAEHPLNPNPGTDVPFLIDIPFEIWNIDDNRQVNLLVYHRLGSPSDNPFEVWNTQSRMYCEINNTTYDPNYVNSGDATNSDTDSLTWNLLFWDSYWENGDVVKLNYFNPLQLHEEFVFTTPEAPTDKISPNQYEVFQNYPNPFNPNTKIRYYIPEEGNVNITVYNILGQKITEVINKTQKAGKYETEFNGSNLASGVYIYRIEIDSPEKGNIFRQTEKMLLLK